MTDRSVSILTASAKQRTQGTEFRPRCSTDSKDNAPASEPSSPACSMHEADDAYMGSAGKEELTAILTELLEAERAGVRVTHETARTAGKGAVGTLIAIEEMSDSAKYCKTGAQATILAARMRAKVEQTA